MTTEEKQPVGSNDSPNVTLTIRLIMQGKEVGSIIGRGGGTVKKFREESGARINISDGACQERIVTITGSPESIHTAFTLITKKLEEDNSTQMATQTTPKPPVTLRLVVPASQCGSLIGKGGSKIKDMRETTGAAIQVASEMLPSSTERAVTISGTPEAITKAVYHVCCVMLESPPKGATIPYRPKPPATPITIFAGGQVGHTGYHQHETIEQPTTNPWQAYALHGGNYAVAHQPDLTKLHQLALQQSPFAIPGQTPFPAGQFQTILQKPYGRFQDLNQNHTINPVNLCPQLKSQETAALSQFGAPQVSNSAPNNQATHEITIPNSLIGCVIGRGGTKIQEIRQLSGANIKIANSQEGSTDRPVTITGTPEAITIAQYLINTSLEMAKGLVSTFDPATVFTTSSTTSVSSTPITTETSPTVTVTANPLQTSVVPTSTIPTPLAVPLSSLLKPVPLLSLDPASLAKTTHYTTKLRAGNAILTGAKKFTPY